MLASKDVRYARATQPRAVYPSSSSEFMRRGHVQPQHLEQLTGGLLIAMNTKRCFRFRSGSSCRCQSVWWSAGCRRSTSR